MYDFGYYLISVIEAIFAHYSSFLIFHTTCVHYLKTIYSYISKTASNSVTCLDQSIFFCTLKVKPLLGHYNSMQVHCQILPPHLRFSIDLFTSVSVPGDKNAQRLFICHRSSSRASIYYVSGTTNRPISFPRGSAEVRRGSSQ